uniref:tetratricopeptide repeat protein 23 isoform X4 n=1 Tax=Pristiophorus japonicus TaxID=55135 RepID=UPI00398EA841
MMNSAALNQALEEDLQSEASSRAFSAGDETHRFSDTGRSSGGTGAPSILNGSARTRRKLRNGMREAAIMTLPEEKLAQAEQRARMHAASQEEVPAVQELMRCVALARISFGGFHWKMAQAHVNLAQGYLELKEAEQNLLKSEKVADELRQAEEVAQEEMRHVDAKITLSLARLYMKENRSDEAVARYEKVLRMAKLDKGGNSMECVSIYRDLAAVEKARGAHSVSVQHLLQAHSIVLTHTPSGEEEGQITLALAEAHTSAGRAEHHEIAERYYKQSLQCHQAAMGPEHASSLSVLDDYCRFLILTKDYPAASRLLQESLPAKLSTFGEYSGEAEETYRLFGGIELAQGHQKAAYKKFRKCLEIQTFLYGSQHKKTRATQQTIKLLSKSPDVALAEGRTGADDLKQRPLFCAVVPKHSTMGGTKANVYD